MGSRRGQLALAAVLVIAAVGATAAAATPLRVLMSRTPNKTATNRTARTIDAIVIHDTEGRFIGSIRALQNPRVDGSAHFVVSRTGQVVQLVPVTDVAWHSGNSRWNLHSIGIEHEGWADRPSYTEKEYRASAALVAYLSHRWGIPLDRTHIIGHADVPDPYHRGEFGGVSHHTDPGAYWNWDHYMWLVRYYSKYPLLPDFVKRMSLVQAPVPSRRAALAGVGHAAPAAKVVTRTHVSVTPVQVTASVTHVVQRSTIDRRAKVHGKARWWSGIDATRRWRRHIWKVDFIVDGRTLYTDHTWPYSFHRMEGWDTRTVANGSHMLTVLAYGTHHYRARKQIPVRVANTPMKLIVDGAHTGGAVRGTVALDVTANEPVERIALYADGKPVSRDGSMPYKLLWDTTAVGEGGHSLVVYARGAHGHRARLRLPVVVANAPAFPAALTQSDSFGFVSPER